MSDRLPAVSEPARGTLPGQNNFQFITVSARNLRGDAETRRRVRSHAQAEYRRRNPPPPPRLMTVELDVTPLLDGSLQSMNAPGAPAARSMHVSPAAGPPTLREASRSDTLGRFNVERNNRSRLLWDHCTYIYRISRLAQGTSANWRYQCTTARASCSRQ
jgi:hypothetical protein